MIYGEYIQFNYTGTTHQLNALEIELFDPSAFWEDMTAHVDAMMSNSLPLVSKEELVEALMENDDPQYLYDAIFEIIQEDLS